MQVWLQRDADLGCPDHSSCIKNLHSSLFSNKMELIWFRVLQLKSEFRQPFRHLIFGASNFSSVIPFPLYPCTSTRAPGFPVVAAVNRILHSSTAVISHLWLCMPDPELFLCLCYISTCWSSEKCPIRISPEKLEYCIKGTCWISNLWQSHFRKEPRVHIPRDLGATVQTPPGNIVQAALNLLLLV